MNPKTVVVLLLSLTVLGAGIVWFRNSSRPGQFSTSIEWNFPIHVSRSSLKPSPEPAVITLRAVGDVMLGRSVYVSMAKRRDWTWPFNAVVPALQPVDFTVGNLEAPLVSSCPLTDSGMVFCAPPAALAGLSYARFSALSLANNHSLNYGQPGFEETKTLLRQAHIAAVEANHYEVVDINSCRFALVALNDVSQPVKLQTVTDLIRDADRQADAVIVLIHWGNEYQSMPSERQRQLARLMIDSGADVIIGAHPHVVQPVERYGSGLVAYSLGNFVFDQMWSEATRKGLILDMDLSFSGKRLNAVSYRTVPVTIFDYGQPRIDPVR